MNFKERIESGGILIFDGAMGTQLEQRGAPAGGESNLKAPEIVVQVQKAYVDAGSGAIIANTFCLCDIYAKSHKMDFDIVEANIKGVELARSAAGGNAMVMGDIGPTGQMLKPYGDFDEEQFYETFLAQAKILAKAGVDAFIIETMSDLKEAVCAVKACSKNFDIPVIASMTYSTERDGGRTVMGDRAGYCAAALAEAGAAVIGANCGELAPQQMATIIGSYRAAVDLPLLAQPNAGKPRIEGDVTVYDMGPAEFAEGIRTCIEAGARLVGGCCGTSPAHIKAVADMAAGL